MFRGHVMPSRRLVALLLLLLGSGASGLAYQVVWLRDLSLVFGVTVYAASTVLAAFMGGLATGSALAGRVLTQVRRPILAFGLAEISIAASALASSVVFDRASAVNVALHGALGDGFGPLTAGRFAVAFALLIVPTSLMGLTLPLISASGVVRASFGSRMSLAYAVNTVGGVCGAVLTGYYAIGLIGSNAALYAAAALNLAVGVGAIALSRATEATPGTADPHDVPVRAEVRARSGGTVAPWVLVVTVAASGAASMALEVLWFRSLVQFIPATTYAFTTMLAAVLVGLALGSYGAALLLRTERDWPAWLAGLYYATAVSSLLSVTWLALPYEWGWIAVEPGPAVALALVPAAACMGASLPLAIHIRLLGAAGVTAAGVASRVGRLYSANVAGAVLGSVVSGFVLLPHAGVRRSLALAAALYLLNAVVVRRQTPGARIWLDAIGIAGVVALAIAVPDPLDSAFARRQGPDLVPIWRNEGAQATVSVHADRRRRVLFIDGLHQASDNPPMVRIHRAIGHLAMALHPDPKDALVIGLGGGATAGAVGQHTGTRLQVVELNDGVRQAANLFAHVNYDVLNRPNFRLHLDDARSFLSTTSDRFDVITADIIQPTHAGAGGLYSREYFMRVRDRLKEGGLVLQWVGQREDTAYKLIARTFLEVFPDTTVWVDGTLLVGTMRPLRVSRAAFERQLAVPETRRALEAVGLTSADALVGWFTAGADALREFVGAGPVLTDDRPLVEYYLTLPAGEPLARLSDLHGDPSTVFVP